MPIAPKLTDQVVVKLRDTGSIQVDADITTVMLESTSHWSLAFGPSVVFTSKYLPLGVVRLPGADPSAVARDLRLHPNVVFADPVRLTQRGSGGPDDPGFVADHVPLDWITVPSAWDLETGSPDVLLAIVDSGIPLDQNGALRHEDLNDPLRYFLGPNFTGDGPPHDRDDCGHGTHVTGIAAAMSNNGKGMAGVNWHSPVFICKVFDRDGEDFPDTNFLRAVEASLDFASKRNITRLIVNYSAGGAVPSDALLQGCTLLAEHGGILCAAIGNSGISEYPAAYAGRADVNIIAVGALDRGASVWGDSGPGATVVAIGDGIVSTSPAGYCARSGTSGSTPFVSGVASLVWSRHPEFSAGQVIDRIKSMAVPPPGGIRPDPLVGWGRVDARRAVEP